jgi:asparagine synthase (glutamine-hydrolysing)
MCGIVCAFELKQPADELRPRLLEMSKKIRHRGPDWSGIHCEDKY